MHGVVREGYLAAQHWNDAVHQMGADVEVVADGAVDQYGDAGADDDDAEMVGADGDKVVDAEGGEVVGYEVVVADEVVANDVVEAPVGEVVTHVVGLEVSGVLAAAGQNSAAGDHLV